MLGTKIESKVMINYKVKFERTEPKRRVSHMYLCVGGLNELRDEVFKRIRRSKDGRYALGRFEVRDDKSYDIVESGTFSTPPEWQVHGKVKVEFSNGVRLER